jgi:hypothetical protein
MAIGKGFARNACNVCEGSAIRLKDIGKEFSYLLIFTPKL